MMKNQKADPLFEKRPTARPRVPLWVSGGALILMLLFHFGCVAIPKPKPWTTEEKVFLAASIIAAGADYASSERMLDRGHYEMNPLYGRHPSDGHLALSMAACQGLTIAIAHYFPGVRKMLLREKIKLNVGLSIHNSRLD